MTNRVPNLPVAERRLRPIYDALDNGNNKKALQECEKVLKKQPELLCAKVLKSLALLRLGKENDCLELLEKVKKECPNDDSVLQAMTVCYREIYKPDMICEIYENASKKDHSNEDILSHLFFSYVRVADYPKQQRTAFSLSKLKSKNSYCFWSVLSLLLQTTDNVKKVLKYFLPPLAYYDVQQSSGEFSSDNHKLRLSEKILEKLVTSKIERDQEVLIYLIVLEMQGKLEEALAVLESPLGLKLENSLLEDKRIDLTIKLGKWDEANNLLKARILDLVDSWNHILFYFKILFKMVETLSEEEKKLALKEAKEFLDTLSEKNDKANEFRKRGPYLAYLEFYSQLETRALEPEVVVGDFISLLMNYLEVFGSKECCLHDLRPYLHLLSPDQAKEFLGRIWTLTALGEKEYPSSRKQMNLHITNLELSRALGYLETMTVDQKMASVSTLFDYFIQAQSFNVDLPSTELRSSDRYALLAIHTLYQLWADTEETNYLFEAIVICHFGLEFSPSNTQFKTLLLKFYHLLGGIEGAQAAYISLDLKHMQLDTLGYMHVYPMISSAHFSAAQTVINSAIKFFTNNSKESSEYITYAYKYEAYTKIPEFIEIRERFDNSTHFMTILVENMVLALFLVSTYPPTLQMPTLNEASSLPDKIKWDKLQDNRDLNVIWDAEPQERRLTTDAVQQTYNHDIAYLRLRSLLLKLIVSLYHIKNSEPNENFYDNDAGYDSSSSNNSTSFSETKSLLCLLTKELEDHIESLKDNTPNATYKKYLAGPPESRLILFVLCNYYDLVLNEVKMCIQLLPGGLGCKEKTKSHFQRIILYFQEFNTSISAEMFKSDDLVTKSLFIKLCTAFTELLSFSCIIHSVCESILKKLKHCLLKKNKKKKEVLVHKVLETQEDFDWKAETVSKLGTVISENIAKLESRIKAEEKTWNDKTKKPGKSYLALNISEEEHRNKLLSLSNLANKNIVQSYCGALSSLSDILKQRLKYLGFHK